MCSMISVIINCFNGEKYISTAIDSALGQSYKNIEIIIWDNQSTDNSYGVVKLYEDPRIKYFYAPSHTPLYQARNLALEKAAGDYLAFLDVDDQWGENKLAEQIQEFSDPLVGLVCSNFYIKNDITNSLKVAYRNKPSGFVFNRLVKDYFVCMSSLIVRSSLVKDLKPFDDRYQIIGDFNFVLKIAKSHKIAFNKYPLVTYRVHEDSVSRNQSMRHIQELKLYLREHSETSKYILSSLNNQILFLRMHNFLKNGKYFHGIRTLSYMSFSLIKVKSVLKISLSIILRV
jgi:glycosyltransferase involved in cell wall biosynthesis